MTSSVEFIKGIYSEVAFISVIFLIFFQLFSDFLESIYILVLMTLSINVNILALLFLLSSLVLLFFKKGIPDKMLLIVGLTMIVCRVVEPLFETPARMVISGLGVGCFLILFPALLLRKDSSKEEQGGLTIGLGLAIAIASSVLLRTLNSTIDLSTHGFGQVIGWVLAIIAAILLIGYLLVEQETIQIENPTAATESNGAEQPSGIKQILGIAIGLTSIFFFITFAFSSPGVISSWTEGNYIAITSMVVVMLTLFVFVVSNKPQLLTRLEPRMILIWNVLFVLAFTLTIVVHQIQFPSTSDIYPIIAPQTTILYHVPLILMLITFPIIVIDFMLLSRGIMGLKSKPSGFTVGGSFTLGGLCMILMILSLVFTSVWGFIPVIGVLFRDMFWLIFLIVGLVLVVSLIPTSRRSFTISESHRTPRTKTIIAGFMIFLFALTLVSGIALDAYPVAQTGNATSVRILTYNIAQGMNLEDVKNYDGQIGLIRDVDADIIGLQETSKIAGSSDVVKYFADKLNLYSYFGPKGVTGTTGVALLSKYPIENPRTIYHFSENIDRKQTATIEAEITVGSNTFTVYVTHTYGRTSAKSILQTDILNEASGKSNVVFMGDFNFRPATEAYNLTTVALDDSWWLKWPTGVDNLGYNNSRNIDNIFVSPGTTISDCEYIWDPQSDHPAYWVDIEW
ncbi:MAG: endonuclease/exonuclease/phosphatase family protein [Candidatus Thorarchaeota archaeon]